jgi:hypothetical protein
MEIGGKGELVTLQSHGLLNCISTYIPTPETPSLIIKSLLYDVM